MSSTHWEPLFPHDAFSRTVMAKLDCKRRSATRPHTEIFVTYDDPKQDEKFVIKECYSKIDAITFKETMAKKFEHLMQWNHSNVIKYFGLELQQVKVLFDSKLIYRIASPYYTGGDLKMWAEKNVTPPMTGSGNHGELHVRHDAVGAFLRDLLTGLDFLHTSVKLVHCDIKPANLMLKQEGHRQVIIIDLDDAVLNDVGGEQSETDNACCTPCYAAPELIDCTALEGIAKAPPISCKTDIWSVGCVAIQLCTGAAPVVCQWQKAKDATNEWEGSYSFGKQLKTKENILYQVARLKAKPKLPDLGDDKLDQLLLSFIKSCLYFDMDSRKTAAELQIDDYFTQVN
ncbi:uncharacterized protein LOC129598230 [Paramacrobiotus metropolitanus]|uniref:uncharacterized protein LOC129598230 n=1 Tax=Paramacrobiotus metropolitanus TaxID=2943436 RepID=UPI0024460629|nr:uncharacterized protein LOC129598230 [Paramacrobiotus metropolitanus]